MKWPSEKQWITIGVFWLVAFMLIIGINYPWLWGIPAFVDMLKLIVTTALVGMIVAASFSTNSGETKTPPPPASGKPDDPVNVEVK